MNSKDKNDLLFDGLVRFPAPGYNDWRYITEKALHKQSFDTLLTPTYEGITLQPIYSSNYKDSSSYPADFPYRRGTKAVKQLNKAWEVNQEFLCSTPEKLNTSLRNALTQGQTSINIILDEASKRGFDPDEAAVEWIGKKGVSLAAINDIKEVFEGIDLQNTPLFIHTGALSLPIFVLIHSYLKTKSIPFAALQGTIGMNPLGMLICDGVLQAPLEVHYEHMAKVISWSKRNSPSLRTVLVEGLPFHDGGANAVEELAFSIASGVEYLRALIEKKISIDDAASSFAFSFSIGSNFFMEIAKFRAARFLWASVVEAFGGSSKHSKIWIHARTSESNKTGVDPYVNIIRSTVEAFSAAVSDIDSLHISPFNESHSKTTPLSKRLARNTHFILQEEAHFNKIIDPAGGSFYIESLTDSIAEQAWTLFQKVEEKGGLYKALQEGFPQQKIRETAKKREENIQYRKDIYVGINKYINSEEERTSKFEHNSTVYEQRVNSIKKWRKTSNEGMDLQIDSLIDSTGKGITIGMITRAVYNGEPSISIQPIPKRRALQLFEKLRCAAAKHKETHVLLVNIGAVSSYRDRVDFTADFLEAGGFIVLKNQEFQTVKEAVAAIVSTTPAAVVLCTDEDKYAFLVPELMKELNKENYKRPVLLAKHSTDEEKKQYEKQGVSSFIYEGCNSYEVLLNLHKERGMQI